MSTEILNLSENEEAAEEKDIVIDIEKRNEGAKRRKELKNGSASDASKSVAVVPKNGHAKSPMEEESLKDRLRVTLLKKCSEVLKNKEILRYTKESLHKTLQDEELVQVIFRLFDLDRKNYLVQKDWIDFLDERLTTEKQTDFVEQVTNVTFMACGTGLVTLDRFELIFHNKNVVIRLFRAIDTDGDGYITSDQLMDFLSLASTIRPRVGYDPLNVDRLEQLFKETVGDQREITREQFRKIFVSKNPFFTERVFQIFDEDDSGTISLQEFITAVHGFTTPEDKLRFLFKVYDLDGNGLIQHPELQAVMRACMEENGMQFSDDQLMDLTGAMFEDADPEGRGAITYEAFQQQMKRHQGLLENLSITIDRWLMPPRAPERKTFLQHLAKLKPYQLSMPYLRNNYVLVTYLTIFFLVNIALFVTRCIQYRMSNYYTIFARGCGQCLNFTCAWILMLMLRNCITWLRPHSPGALFPLDHHVYLHKLTGVLICVYSLVHTAMHLCNFSLVVIYDPVINKNHYTLFEWLLTPRPGLFGLIPGYANVTGVVLVGILLIMFVCSQPFIRRRGSFEVFYWTHLLYIPFWVLLIIHGPNFWKWFVLPGTLYIAERVMRFAWMRTARGKTYITSGILLPSRVTHISLRRPPSFEFRAGDYVYVNVPAVAKYEWHPFTISSAPEQPDYIWLHIRGVGGWTNRLYDYFEKEQERLNPPEEDDVEVEEETPSGPIEMFRSSLRKSKRKSARLSKKRSVVFRHVGQENVAFAGDNGQSQFPGGSASPMAPARLLATPLRLEKTCSMPDVRNSEHNRLRRLALRAYPRAESELRFAGGASPGAGGSRDSVLAERLYRSPHHRALAHSFRYMRNKPSIIAFEAPKEEDHDRRPSNESIITIARRRLSKSLSPDKDVETAARKSAAPNGAAASPSTDDPDSFPIGKPLVIYLDGPYGAPSSRLFGAQHAVLVAAGIGVTPFASVLQSIMHRHWSARSECPSCGHTWANALPTLTMNLTKVDFFWINREQRSFEWFVSLLSQLEMEQAELGGEMERFLEMHMYISSALQRNDMKAVGLQLALDLLHEKEKRDLITGLKTRTNAGRPNWDKVFKNLQQQNKGQVTVFYCGPPHLAKILRDKCHQFGFRFRKEVF